MLAVCAGECPACAACLDYTFSDDRQLPGGLVLMTVGCSDHHPVLAQNQGQIRREVALIIEPDP